MKTKRSEIKEHTQKINMTKGEIDRIKTLLDKKEEERKLQSRAQKAELEAFGDDNEIQQEEIIDEEELVLLKELKDVKRDYRDTYSKIKGLKQELNALQENIDASKEQLIYQFENWYADEFEPEAIHQKPI